MHINKKISLSLLSLTAFTTVACSSNNSSVPAVAMIDGNVNFSQANLVRENLTKGEIVPKIEKVIKDSLSDEHVFIDVGNGQKTGASLSIKLNFDSGAGFKTKAAAVNNTGYDGTAGSVKSVRVWLREVLTGFDPTNTNPLNPGTSIAVFNYDNLSTAPVLTFTNVNNNTTSGGPFSYIVAVAAYNDNAVTPTPTHGGVIPENNVTAFVSGNSDGVRFGGTAIEQATISKLGGDSGAPGTIHVAGANFTPTSFTGLNVAIKLKDAYGASIGTDVGFTDGNTAYTPGVTGVGKN